MREHLLRGALVRDCNKWLDVRAASEQATTSVASEQATSSVASEQATTSEKRGVSI